jgi:hypothetical protein
MLLVCPVAFSEFRAWHVSEAAAESDSDAVHPPPGDDRTAEGR